MQNLKANLTKAIKEKNIKLDLENVMIKRANISVMIICVIII